MLTEVKIEHFQFLVRFESRSFLEGVFRETPKNSGIVETEPELKFPKPFFNCR